MNATEILSQEHRVIEQVLRCLEKIAEQAILENRLDVPSAKEALEFFRVFADGCHHAKEEHLLFPRLEAKGFPVHYGPTAVMREEHQQGRRVLRVMNEAVDDWARGGPYALRAFVDAAREYSRLLHSHILKEDWRLFPMAVKVLDAEEQENLLQSFDVAEDSGEHEKYLRLADELADRFGVPRAELETEKCAGCGSCACRPA